jgi:hypothetical protein
MPDVNGELDIAYSCAQEFGAIALEWLTEGVSVLAAGISEKILAGPALAQPYAEEVTDEADPRFVLRVPPLWGEIQVLYSPRDRLYAKPYSRTSLKRLTALAPELREASVELRAADGAGVTRCRLDVVRDGEDSGHARLLVLISRSPDGDITADRPEVAFMKSFAGRPALAFGHVSRVSDPPAGQTDLEQALIRRVWDSLREWDRYLRGYSWVTVVPQVLARQVGGLDGLRASGAFVVVDQLPGGVVWLQATDRWSGYQGDRVERVFEALAPVLPPGMPQPDLPRMPGSIDYLVSWRDAVAFQPGKPEA